MQAMQVDFRSPSVFKAARHWFDLPPDISFGEVVDIAVDAEDRIYLFNRGTDPVIVLEADGRFAATWGRGIFAGPHALEIGPDGLVYCTDYKDHTLRIFTPDGRLRRTIGEPFRHADFLSGQPFNGCTDATVGLDGSIYVADGYGNARIHKFDPTGRHLLSWGTPGTDPGQFIIPHNIGCDDEGMIYVADRENHRVQIFDAMGRFEAQWHAYRAQGLYVSRHSDLCIVAEDCAVNAARKDWTHAGSRVIVTDRQGHILQRIGGARPGHEGMDFIAPHGIGLNARGEIFVADLAGSTWSRFFDVPVPTELSSAIKLTAAPAALGGNLGGDEVT